VVYGFRGLARLDGVDKKVVSITGKAKEKGGTLIRTGIHVRQGSFLTADAALNL